MSFLRNSNPLQKLHGQPFRFHPRNFLHIHWPKNNVFQYREVGEKVELLEDYPYLLAETINVNAWIMDRKTIYPKFTRINRLQPIDSAD